MYFPTTDKEARGLALSRKRDARPDTSLNKFLVKTKKYQGLLISFFWPSFSVAGNVVKNGSFFQQIFT
jgi:hypothetical protein